MGILLILCIISYGVHTSLSIHILPSFISNARQYRSRADGVSTAALNALQWPFFQKPVNQSEKLLECENGLDQNYPWRFEGRFIFRPSLVKVPKDENDLPPCSSLISAFGYTLGGSVVLEYDDSPVGPYREYVVMGGLVALGRVTVGESSDDPSQMRSLGVGQWGTHLYVTTQVAEDVCKEVWGVPATLADIQFIEDGEKLQDGPDETTDNGRRKFNLSGWNNARILTRTPNSRSESNKRFGNIPIFWTPTIKALWAPVSFPFQSFSDKPDINSEQALPVHKLRLSASALRLKKCDRSLQKSSHEIPLGLVLVVDNVLIEIGRRVSSGSISIFS